MSEISSACKNETQVNIVSSSMLAFYDKNEDIPNDSSPVIRQQSNVIPRRTQVTQNTCPSIPIPIPQTVSVPIPIPQTVSVPIPIPQTVSVPIPIPIPIVQCKTLEEGRKKEISNNSGGQPQVNNIVNPNGQQCPNEKNVTKCLSANPVQTHTTNNFKPNICNSKVSLQSSYNNKMFDRKLLIRPNNQYVIIKAYNNNYNRNVNMSTLTSNSANNKKISPKDDKKEMILKYQNKALSKKYIPIYSEETVRRNVSKYLLHHRYQVMQNQSNKNKIIRSPWDDINAEKFKLIALKPKRKVHIVDAKSYVRKKLILSLPYKTNSIENNLIIRKPEVSVFERYDYASTKNIEEISEKNELPIPPREESGKMEKIVPFPVPVDEAKCTLTVQPTKETSNEEKSSKRLKSNQNTFDARKYELQSTNSKLVDQNATSISNLAAMKQNIEIPKMSTSNDVFTVKNKKIPLPKNTIQDSEGLISSKGKRSIINSVNTKNIQDENLKAVVQQENTIMKLNEKELLTPFPTSKLNSEELVQEKQKKETSLNNYFETEMQKNTLIDEFASDTANNNNSTLNNQKLIENLNSNPCNIFPKFSNKECSNIATITQPLVNSMTLQNLPSNALKQFSNGANFSFITEDQNRFFYSNDIEPLNLVKRKPVQFNTDVSKNTNDTIKITEIDNIAKVSKDVIKTSVDLVLTKNDKFTKALDLQKNSCYQQHQNTTNVEEPIEGVQEKSEEGQDNSISVQFNNMHVTKEIKSLQNANNYTATEKMQKEKKSKTIPFFDLNSKNIVYYKIRPKCNTIGTLPNSSQKDVLIPISTKEKRMEVPKKNTSEEIIKLKDSLKERTNDVAKHLVVAKNNSPIIKSDINILQKEKIKLIGNVSSYQHLETSFDAKESQKDISVPSPAKKTRIEVPKNISEEKIKFFHKESTNDVSNHTVVAKNNKLNTNNIQKQEVKLSGNASWYRNSEISFNAKTNQKEVQENDISIRASVKEKIMEVVKKITLEENEKNLVVVKNENTTVKSNTNHLLKQRAKLTGNLPWLPNLGISFGTKVSQKEVAQEKDISIPTSAKEKRINVSKKIMSEGIEEFHKECTNDGAKNLVVAKNNKLIVKSNINYSQKQMVNQIGNIPWYQNSEAAFDTNLPFDIFDSE